MGMTHPAISDDSGTRIDGTVWNNAWETAHDAAIDAAIAGAFTPTASAPTTTGNQTALALPTNTGGPLATHHNNATLTTIQGMAAGTHGQLWFQYSKGAGQVDFAHLHASGTALGKLKLFATTGLTSLAAGSGVAVFQYDTTVTQWRLVAHEQGAWITPTYADANFTTDAGDNWGVDSGDVTNFRYRLRGRELAVEFTISTSSVTGTPTQLRISNAAFGGFTGASVTYAALAQAFNNSAGSGGLILMNATTFLALLKYSGTWVAEVNVTYMYGQITFDVT
jgi:hypothetical protein